jgi:hypothetical protein
LLPSALLGFLHCQSSFVIDAAREEEGIFSNIIISQSTFQGCGKGLRKRRFWRKSEYKEEVLGNQQATLGTKKEE